jgi:anaerobic magnesium-protoporphyrin IX monomethyl ester cyclase
MPAASVVQPTGGAQVLLVGYEDRDNLGIRYLLSSLRAVGYSGDIVRYNSDPAKLIVRARAENPLVIGFSLIFQYMAPDFGRVISALREAGIDSHITIGGHYASFDPEEIMLKIRGLDSVTRYEGEKTLIELVERLTNMGEWREITGIAYRDGENVHLNPLRPPVTDLDTLPRPDRTSFNYESEVLPTAAILGSRGCPWDCTFCSIRPFYEAQGGTLRRFREPREVVDEMLELYHERGIYLYLFQDDDFLAGSRRAQRWACEIADGIIEAGLAGKLAFKISCRSDEIDRDCLAHLQRGGLTHVYMGVEAGDEDDLLAMNKRLKPITHIKAGEVMRSLDMSFDFGFMLLQPYRNLGLC